MMLAAVVVGTVLALLGKILVLAVIGAIAVVAFVIWLITKIL